MSQSKSGGNTAKKPATDRDRIDFDRYKAAGCHIGLAVFVPQGYPMRAVNAMPMTGAWRDHTIVMAAFRTRQIETIRHDASR